MSIATALEMSDVVLVMFFVILHSCETKLPSTTGSMLAPSTLVARHTAALQNLVLGNPHSVNSPSAESSYHDEEAREAVLRYVNANPGPNCKHVAIWTANASAAIKIVGECFPFNAKGGILYAPDCHNSVLGITAFAKSKGAKIASFSFQKNSMCWDLDSLRNRLGEGGSMRRGGMEGGDWLLVLPGQSNMSGIKHPIKV